ncbi:MAG: Uma2 family endonuclease [Anaerolineae bacterium]|nr:Uma2 family endonuclease [Anaerolineae bacterium]
MITALLPPADEITLPWDRELTEADFLDPRLGDHFMQGHQHARDVEKAHNILRFVHHKNPHTLVTTDVKMVWGRRGLLNPAPDVAVIPNVAEPMRPRTSFFVREEETRPVFILEVVSPKYRRPDVEAKVSIYEQAGVAEYFIIDSNLQPDEQMQYEIIAYRLIRGEYQPIVPDEQGRYYSYTNHIWFAVTPDRQGFIVIDGDSEVLILPDEERAAAAAQQAEQYRQEAHLALREAESARYQAESARQEADLARQQAEAEAAARAQAERQVVDLMAELDRLRGRA